MDASGASLVGTAVADDGIADDEGRFASLRFRLGDGGGYGVEVAPVHCAQYLPAVGLEPARHVFEEGYVGVSLDGNLVVVIYGDELAQAKGSGERGGFGGHSFLKVAIRDQGIGVVVNDFVAGAVEASGQPTLGEGHAHGVGESLPQRAGGDFDAGGEAVFRVTGGLAAPLPELLQLFHGKVIAGQVEQGIQQGRGVSGGKDEAVAVGPAGSEGLCLRKRSHRT